MNFHNDNSQHQQILYQLQSLSALSVRLNLLIYFQLCMLIIPLVSYVVKYQFAFHPVCPHFIWCPQFQCCSYDNLEFSLFSPTNVYQP